MTRTDKSLRLSLLLATLLFVTAVACSSPAEEETPVLATPPAVASGVTEDGGEATSQVTSIPGGSTSAIPATRQATATRGLAPTARPTVTPRQAEPIRPTLASIRSLPAGWQRFGDERIGIQLAAPATWTDASNLLWASNISGRFGPRVLLLTDSEETARRMIDQTITTGAFVIGYITEELAEKSDPSAALLELIADGVANEDGPIRPRTLTVNGDRGAFTDLEGDPFGVFKALNTSQRFRLALFIDEEERAFVILMRARAAEWETYEDTFTLVLETLTVPEASTNVLDQLISGQLVRSVLDAEKSDIWLFEGQENHYATVTLAPIDSGIDLTLALINPDGYILATTDDGYDGDPEALTDVLLPADGFYLVEVGEFFNESGRYQLNFSLAEAPQFGGGGRLEFGQEVTSELVTNGEHLWFFEGTAGQDVTIIVSPLDEQLDAIVDLRGPDGRDLVTRDESFAGDTEILTGFALDVTGEYVIVVQGFAGRGGTYSISLDEGGESTANFYEAGDLQYGENNREFLREDEAHAWFFDGRSGEEVTIDVTPLEPNLDIDVWLLDPELNQLVTEDQFTAGEAERIDYTLPVDGLYLILVREFFGDPGEYEITLDVIAENTLEVAGTLAYSQTVTGRLEAGKRVGWTFMGEADDVVDIILTPGREDRDLVIVLVDPAGDAVITADTTLVGFPERLIGYRLPVGGRWMILIKEFFNDGSDYTLTLTRQSSPRALIRVEE